MGVELNYRLACDECNAIVWLGWYPADMPAQMLAAQALAVGSWRVVDGRLICPNHVIKVEPAPTRS